MSSPEAKRAAGKGVVGYIRVSSAGQTDGYSLDSQEQTIRAWAAQHQLRVIAICRAPEGHESGAAAFDDRAGWQEVERHIATGQVGWLAVAAIDRLSRDLAALADRVRAWMEADIAIVAPALGYGQLEGLGTFMLHIWGMMADFERKRLLGRILPGMQARLQAGLPLGTQPFGFRIATEAPMAGQRPRRHLEPDPATAPVVQALFAQAVAEPDWGDRRLAAWAAVQWPQETWSPGRIAKMLEHPVYAGVLRGSLQGEPVLLIGNHQPIVAPAVFAQVQQARERRARDRAAGRQAVNASSWLGGIVRCSRCGGVVIWRAFAPGPDGQRPVGGRYSCAGSRGAEGSTVPACGWVWDPGIEVFVWRAIEQLLERDVQTMARVAGNALDRLPGLLDERRRQAAATAAQAEVRETQLTDAVAAGAMTPAQYATAIRAIAAERAAAQALLAETDGWSYLARLIAVVDGPQAGRWRLWTFQEMLLRLPLPERRRLLGAIAARIALADPNRIGSLDGPGEDPAVGRFAGVTITAADISAGADGLAGALAQLLVHHPGWDVDGSLRAHGWEREYGADGPVWRAPEGVGRIAVISASDTTNTDARLERKKAEADHPGGPHRKTT